MSTSMKIIPGNPAFQVSKTNSLPRQDRSPQPTTFRPGTGRGPLVLLLGLLLFLASSGLLRAGLTVYEANNPTDAQNPPKDGQGPWLPVGKGAQGLPLNPGQTIWLACNNNMKGFVYKHWTLVLTSTGQPGDVSIDNLSFDPESAQGWDATGKGVTVKMASGTRFDKVNGVRTIEVTFVPQPAWERIALKNAGNAPIAFNVEGSSDCNDEFIAANTMAVPSLYFGAVGPGVMVSNQFITTVAVFPRTVAINAGRMPTFSAPAGSGQWTSYAAFEDPYGNPAPLGGFVFECNGPGLVPGQPCGFSFAMQGLAADMQYQMYAYDSVLQEFQEYDWDLRPSVSINASNNFVGLTFDTVPGETYTVFTSPDLGTWQPLQSFAGAGQPINWQTPIIGQAGFFRVGCAPSPIPTNPPAVIGVSAPAGSNALTITFSEPVDETTALNPANYFLFSGSHTIPINGVSPFGTRAVELTLGAILISSNSYALGVTGVRDQAGHVIAPATFPIQPVSLQTPCPGGTLLARQTYSECNPDGFWHVVEDDWYDCPPVTKFRVADTATTQPCGSVQTPPNPVGKLYCTDADVVTTSQNFIEIGPVNVCTCAGGLWSVSSYVQYQCQDGTLFMRGPIQTVPMNPATPCGQTPPLSPAPQ
jgi:hypothetical protein